VSTLQNLLYHKQIPPLHSIHFPNFTVLQTKSSSAQFPLSKLYCITNKFLLCTVSTLQTLLYHKQNTSSAQCKAPQFHYTSKVKPDFTNPLPEIHLTAPPKSTSAKAQSSISGLITPHHGASQAVKGAKHRMRYALDSLLAHDTLLINQKYPTAQPEMPHNFASKRQKRTLRPSVKKGPRKRGPQKQLNLYS
jgi:hypothetical protein